MQNKSLYFLTRGSQKGRVKGPPFVKNSQWIPYFFWVLPLWRLIAVLHFKLIFILNNSEMDGGLFCGVKHAELLNMVLLFTSFLLPCLCKEGMFVQTLTPLHLSIWGTMETISKHLLKFEGLILGKLHCGCIYRYIWSYPKVKDQNKYLQTAQYDR